jgi:hypothetical protein
VEFGEEHGRVSVQFEVFSFKETEEEFTAKALRSLRNAEEEDGRRRKKLEKRKKRRGHWRYRNRSGTLQGRLRSG